MAIYKISYFTIVAKILAHPEKNARFSKVVKVIIQMWWKTKQADALRYMIEGHLSTYQKKDFPVNILLDNLCYPKRLGCGMAWISPIFDSIQVIFQSPRLFSECGEGLSQRMGDVDSLLFS